MFMSCSPPLYLRYALRSALIGLLSLLLIAPVGQLRATSVRVEEKSSPASEELDESAAAVPTVRNCRSLNMRRAMNRVRKSDMLRRTACRQIIERHAAHIFWHERADHNGCGTVLLC